MRTATPDSGGGNCFFFEKNRGGVRSGNSAGRRPDAPLRRTDHGGGTNEPNEEF